MPFELFIALRYLVARRRQAFISLISLVSTLGVAVGVTALVIALALMSGLQDELRDRILGSAAHVYVWKLAEAGVVDPATEMARLREMPHVTGAAPVVLGKALVRRGERDAFVTLKGIDPVLEGNVTDLVRRLQSGSLKALDAGGNDQPPGIAIGQTLAQDLGAAVGDSVTVLTPEGVLTPMGIAARTRRMTVVAIFSFGLYEYDASYGLVSLGTAKRLLGKVYPDYIELRVDDIYQAPAVAADITRRLGNTYGVQDWADVNGSLFSALWLEKMAISITIGLIVMVAALNIIASLVLMVMEKSRDIAILKTMGAGARSIMTVFMLQGLLIGAAGTLAGAVAGRGLSYLLDHYRLIRIPLEVYQIAYVPFKIANRDFILVLLIALAICFVATLYPSRQAARLDPAEALRYS
jgi:lipoprotein-releasing system permease protein